jgi:hypothetical protein
VAGALLLMVALAVPAGASPIFYRNAKGKFAAEMPRKPKMTRKVVDSIIGEIICYVFIADSIQGTYTMAYTELPWAARTFLSDSELYEKAKNGLLNHCLARQISWQPTTLSGASGMELKYQLPSLPGQAKRLGTAKFLLANERLYAAVIEMPELTTGQPAEAFMNSVVIYQSPPSGW